MAYNASEGYLGRDGSRVRQDGGPPVRWRCVLTGLDTAGEEHDTGEGFMLFMFSAFVLVFERANERSGNDTGVGEPEPPIYPIYAIVYIVLRIYKSSIEYYTSMTLMYGTRYYTRYQVFILLSLYSVYNIYII